MNKYVFLLGALLVAGKASASGNIDGSISSSVLCQPQWPYTHNQSVIYENGRIKALENAHVICPIEVNNDLREEGAFTWLQVWVRVNNTYSAGRVQCRLKNFNWKGQLELNTPWITTGSDGYGGATLEISADYINRGGQTTMECIMPASSYIENYQTEPRFSIL